MLYVKRCIESIVNQHSDDAHDYEIIVVDDGSTDDSGDIVAELAGNNACIRLIRQKNSGIGASRNVGMNVACGKYIYFLDADDVLLPNTITPQLDMMDKENLDALHLEFEMVQPEEVDELLAHTQKPMHLQCSKVITGIQYLRDTDLLMYKPDSGGQVWQVIFRLDVIKKHDLKFISGRCEDSMFHIEYMTNAQRVAWSDVRTYVYVLYRNSTCRRRYSYEVTFRISLPVIKRLQQVKVIYHDVYEKNDLLRFIEIYSNWLCYTYILWPMVRECVPPRTCSKDIANLRDIGIYPVAKPTTYAGFNFRDKKIINYLWLLSRHYYLWMMFIAVNHLLRKTPEVESERVGR
jgi:glycosyltransferase involved in cell wall biosynthesis